MIQDGSKVYGRHPVLELLRAERRAVHKIYLARGTKGPQIDELMHIARSRDVEVVPEIRESLDRLVGHSDHQGVVAVCGERQFATIEEILALAASRGEAPLILLADGIEDPGNLGNMLRSAEAAGVHGVVIPRHRAAGMTPVVQKASAGAAEHLLIAQVANVAAVIQDIKKDHGIWITGADASGDRTYTEVDFRLPVAIVVGGEGKGLRTLVRERCDFVARIPMVGKVASLNAASAAAVLLFEARRQRSTAG